MNFFTPEQPPGDSRRKVSGVCRLWCCGSLHGDDPCGSLIYIHLSFYLGSSPSSLYVALQVWRWVSPWHGGFGVWFANLATGLEVGTCSLGLVVGVGPPPTHLSFGIMKI